jgi:hypothetical protein
MRAVLFFLFYFIHSFGSIHYSPSVSNNCVSVDCFKDLSSTLNDYNYLITLIESNDIDIEEDLAQNDEVKLDTSFKYFKAPAFVFNNTFSSINYFSFKYNLENNLGYNYNFTFTTLPLYLKYRAILI